MPRLRYTLYRWALLHFEELIMFGMMSDPNPNQSFASFFGNCTILKPDTCRPKETNFLEADGRMPRILFQ